MIAYRRVESGREGGRFCTKRYAEANPDSTCMVTIEIPDTQDPRIFAIVHSLEAAKVAPDHDVAEFITDANVKIAEYYRDIMASHM